MMKNIVILALTILFLAFQSSYGQWIGRGDYEEMDVRTQYLDYFKISSDSSAVFIQDRDTLKKIDLTDGDLLEEYFLSGTKKSSCAVSSDDKSYAYAFWDSNVDDLKISVVDIMNSSNITFIPYDPHPDRYTVNLGDYSIISFHPNNEDIIVGMQYRMSAGPENASKGNLAIYNQMDGISKKRVGIGKSIRSLNLSPSTNLLAYNYSYSYRSIGMGDYISHSDKGLNLYNFDSSNTLKLSKIDADTINTEFNTAYNAFSSDSKYLTSLINKNEICTWETENGKLIDQFYLSHTNIKSILYSKKHDYLLLGTNNEQKQTVFLLMDVSKRVVIDSIVFESSFEINTFDHINDSTILMHCSDGFLRKIQPKLLSDKLNAIFSAKSLFYQTGDEVQFQNYSTGHAKYHFWAFGDGGLSYEENPVHKFRGAGEYEVRLIVSDGSREDTTTRSITYKERLAADFVANPAESYYPMRVQFQDRSSGEIDSLLWDFGDGETAIENNPEHIYQKPGEYTVSLIISNEAFKDTIIKEKYLISKRPFHPSIDYEREVLLSGINPEGIDGVEISPGNYIIDVISTNKTYDKYEREYNWYPTTALYKINDSRGLIWDYQTEIPSDKPRFLNYSGDGNILLYGSRLIGTFVDLGNIAIIDTNGILLNFNGDNSWNHYFDIINTTSSYISLYFNGNKLHVNKFNINFEIDWTKDFHSISLPPKGHRIAKISECKNGNFAFVSTNERGEGVFTLIDSVGSLLNNYTLSDSAEFYATGLFSLPGHSFIVTGYGEIDSSYRGIAMKIDKNGNEIWKYITEKENIAWLDMVQLSENTFAMTGELEGFTGYTVMDTDGNILEDHRFKDRPGHFNSITKTEDGGVFLVGNINFQNWSNVYVVKTYPIPNYSSNVEAFNLESIITCYPNPSNDFITFNYKLERSSIVRLSIYSVLGEEIPVIAGSMKDIGEHYEKYGVQNLPMGVYLYKLFVDGVVYDGKFVVGE